MIVDLKVKRVVKDDGTIIFLLEHWFTYDNGKKYKYHTEWLRKDQYLKLKDNYENNDN